MKTYRKWVDLMFERFLDQGGESNDLLKELLSIGIEQFIENARLNVVAPISNDRMQRVTKAVSVLADQVGKDAQKYWEETVRNKTYNTVLPELEVESSGSILDLLVDSKIAPSRSQARRLINQLAVKLGGSIITDPEERIGLIHHGMVLVVGKKIYKLNAITYENN